MRKPRLIKEEIYVEKSKRWGIDLGKYWKIDLGEITIGWRIEKITTKNEASKK